MKPVTVTAIFCYNYKMQYVNAVTIPIRRACSTEEAGCELLDDKCVRLRLQCTELYHIPKVTSQLIVDVPLRPL